MPTCLHRYSHRSNVLHAMVLVQKDNWPMGSASVALAIVPMFHANRRVA